MRVAIAADHAGYRLKEELKGQLLSAGHEVQDLGTHSEDPVDYPDFALALGLVVVRGEVDRGVLLCGSGAGASVAANKVPGVRAVLATDGYTAHQAVEHDDCNVLALGARVIGPALAWELVEAFLGAKFERHVERYQRRLDKVIGLEHKYSVKAW